MSAHQLVHKLEFHFPMRNVSNNVHALKKVQARTGKATNIFETLLVYMQIKQSNKLNCLSQI